MVQTERLHGSTRQPGPTSVNWVMAYVWVQMLLLCTMYMPALGGDSNSLVRPGQAVRQALWKLHLQLQATAQVDWVYLLVPLISSTADIRSNYATTTFEGTLVPPCLLIFTSGSRSNNAMTTFDGLIAWSPGPNIYKDTKPQMSAFLKNWRQEGSWRQVFIWARTPPLLVLCLGW